MKKPYSNKLKNLEEMKKNLDIDDLLKSSQVAKQIVSSETEGSDKVYLLKNPRTRWTDC